MLTELPTNLQLNGKKDRLFDSGSYPIPFEFNHEVVEVFDNMVSRSVPLYKEVIHAIIEWTYYFYQDSSEIYDLGCSTGTTLKALVDNLPFPIQGHGIDSSAAMIEKAKEKLHKENQTIDLHCADITEANITNASIVICNYTLQFIPVAKRLNFLKKVYNGLNPNGVFILSEKLRSGNPQLHDATTHIYESFKLRAGYSKSEIERKKEALDQVLVPFSLEEQVQLLKDVGFQSVEPMIRWHNFCTFIAQK